MGAEPHHARGQEEPIELSLGCDMAKLQQQNGKQGGSVTSERVFPPMLLSKK